MSANFASRFLNHVVAAYFDSGWYSWVGAGPLGPEDQSSEVTLPLRCRGRLPVVWVILVLWVWGPHALADQPATNAQKGTAIFRTHCSMCHELQAGDSTKYGPNLQGVFGRKAGSLPGYNYSLDLRGSSIVWTAQTLSEYLADPHGGRRGVKNALSAIIEQN